MKRLLTIARAPWVMTGLTAVMLLCAILGDMGRWIIALVLFSFVLNVVADLLRWRERR